MADIKYYTLEEVAKNNGKDGQPVWIIIRDNVYDVTSFLDDHPGGGDLITEWAGKDGTKAFDEFGHSGDAKRDLKQYKIGEIVEEHNPARLSSLTVIYEMILGEETSVSQSSATEQGAILVPCGKSSLEERKKKTQKKASEKDKEKNGNPVVVDAKDSLQRERSFLSVVSCGLCG